jgi:hypothetical protein
MVYTYSFLVWSNLSDPQRVFVTYNQFYQLAYTTVGKFKATQKKHNFGSLNAKGKE